MDAQSSSPRLWQMGALAGALIVGGAALTGWWMANGPVPDTAVETTPVLQLALPRSEYEPRQPFDTAGWGTVAAKTAWSGGDSLERIATAWRHPGYRLMDELNKITEAQSKTKGVSPALRLKSLVFDASMLNYEGEPKKAYALLEEARTLVETQTDQPELAKVNLFALIYYQGLTALRRGETDNCILCRGESSCILPISPAAVHTNPTGSRLAIKHFTEYLELFPDDFEVRWLLNIAHMTLGEHPDKVDPRYRIIVDHLDTPEFAIGKFRDVGSHVGINRLNQAGGAILDDFDGDGLLDFVFTCMDPTVPMIFYKNTGDGKFEDRTGPAGLSGQLGGLYCVQADYDNDGHLDIFIPRGAWLRYPMRPSLLKNNGDGTFTDATEKAGLLEPMNSITAQWVDFDNDGRLDLFVAGERQPNKLYRNKGDGTFADVAGAAGVAGKDGFVSKGVAWLDYDNDRYPDLFINSLSGDAVFYRNTGKGTFVDSTAEVGIDGPQGGFSCWAWDYDNDGWTDIFATCYDRTVTDVVMGLTGQPHRSRSNKLFKNMQGRRFKDVTKEIGLDLTFTAMGSNFGDFDNDGYPDMYLGTGDPQLSTLIPNRMMRNLGGKRFVEITGSSGTGNLQKGHGVACGDWDRDGDVDVAIQMGGAAAGDQYHNILFQNPGQGNRSITVKLIGETSNRSAIGARIKVTTAGEKPQTVYRHVSSGSSFGANPLEQTIGLGKADRVAEIEVFWPTTGKTQTFRDIPAGGWIEITENGKEIRTREFKPIAVVE